MKRYYILTLLCLLSLTPFAFSSDQIILAVLDFQNNTEDRAFNYLEKAIPEMLITNLMASSKITIVERTRLQHILEEHKLMLSGAIDEETMTEIGKLIGANHLLYGSIFKSGEKIRLDARICDTSSGKIIVAEKIEMSEGMDLIELIDELSIKLLAGLTNEQITIDYSDDVISFTPEKGKALAVTCEIDNRYKLQDSTEPTYLLISLVAGKVVKEQQRLPLNICMVIDKSGSMSSDNKLENVKKAALFVVDNLSKDDYLSLVSYDTHVYTVISSNLALNKEHLKAIIQDITSGSSTNLSGGLLEGYAQVAVNFKRGYVNRELLLTDGLANTGITNPLQLKKIVAEKNRDGYTLSTFGVGSDFNEDLLTTLAEFGGANYYFIDSPDRIADIFSNELQGLLSIVAQNAVIEIEPAAGVKISDLFGYTYTTDENKIKVKLNDIFSEETKSILIKMDLPGTSKDNIKICDVTIKYDDVVLKNQRIIETFSPAIEIASDEKLVHESKNPIVHENIALFESIKLLDEAVSHIDQRDYEKAEESIQNNLIFLKENLNSQSSKRLKQQMLNVVKYSDQSKEAENMDAMEKKMMQKSIKYESYLQKKKK